MDVSGWMILLGGVFEVGGLVVAVLDIKRTRDEMQHYERRPQTIYAGTARIRVQASSPSISVEGGREPTVEERLSALEERVGALTEEQTQAEERLRTELRQEIADSGTRSEMGARDRSEALDALLKGVIRPSLRGIGLVIVGVALSVTGSLLN